MRGGALSLEKEHTETAWLTHQYLTDLIGKADNKARFAMSIESAVLAGVIAISGEGERLGSLEGCMLAIYWIGVLLLVAGILISAVAVFPRLQQSEAKREWKTGLIYFGHLRHWDASHLAEKLKDTDMVPVLARQLVALSAIAWQKHRLIQFSFGAAGSGAVLIALAGLVGSH